MKNFSWQTVWSAPPEADQLINPFSGNKSANDEGRKIYMRMCFVCHGQKGKGDGLAGPGSPSLVSKEIQAQTDGALYWKITYGNPPMPGYKNSLREEERWQVVNYLRLLYQTQLITVK